MKKSFCLFSSIALSMLLILTSCSKENVSSPNPYVKEVTPGYTDTPYLGPLNVVDTPYLRTLPASTAFVDTPYKGKSYPVKRGK